MITEDRISFETAKLLKEKGFDEYCGYYSSDGEYWGYCVCNHKGKDYISAPTLQMTMKWLREKGWFIHINIIREASCWTVDIQDIKNNVGLYIPKGYGFSSYEEACEAAIKYCLENLI